MTGAAEQRGNADDGVHGEETVAGVPQLGARLRDLRARKKMSLTEAAERSGLSKGFLSRVERDQGSVSMASLMRLCSTLEIEAADLFHIPTGHLVRAAHKPRIAFGGVGLTEFHLTPQGERRIQVLLSEVEPGGGSGAETYTLPVDIEFLHLLSGQLTITINDKSELLEAGDSLLFPGSVPHAFHNPGPTPASMMWVLSPALPSTGSEGST